MTNITIDGIAALLKQELHPINNETLSQHSEVLNGHTTALDKILKNTTDWNTEMVVMRN